MKKLILIILLAFLSFSCSSDSSEEIRDDIEFLDYSYYARTTWQDTEGFVYKVRYSYIVKLRNNTNSVQTKNIVFDWSDAGYWANIDSHSFTLNAKETKEITINSNVEIYNPSELVSVTLE